ncbi:MAG: hypothetical protein ACI9XB_000694 [Gammaproteobacteria bacterium]
MFETLKRGVSPRYYSSSSSATVASPNFGLGYVIYTSEDTDGANTTTKYFVHNVMEMVTVQESRVEKQTEREVVYN